MEDTRYLSAAEDVESDDVLNERVLRMCVGVGFILLIASIFTPASWHLGGLHLLDAFITVGFLVIIVPLLMVSVHQFKTRKHFGVILHLICPVIGLLMLVSRMILQPLGATTVFLNLWSIFATFLIFPLFQQLIELVSGSVDMITDGVQVRYDND
ncbi:hypothetical protein [Bifidobacterium oedipodis]|uniref:Uncharacterized protein n=1 Tax=Bifidobacterium oedipodis TaxID=2675322 RepID=A0A7Y0EN18_9BIFI|nr:hypothetical protein [Bifidobacterium sp. DSM 109957]NMM93290.1 hypothetical protein [Bifidobacterium sp. DSM 109957]